jgi:hypothetical protein
MSKSLLISIPNYGNTQLDLLRKVIEEFKSYKEFSPTISVHTTVELDIPNIITTMYDESIKWDLEYKHRWEFAKEINNYDYFLCTENDTLIKEEALKIYCEREPYMPLNTCIGFVRYEQKTPDSDLSLTDTNYYGGIREKNINIGNRMYFEMDQQFQGSWILSREKLKQIIDLPFFLKIVEGGETATTGIFSRWGGPYRKITPQNEKELKLCMVNHISNKYVNTPNYPRRMFLTDLKRELEI